MKKRIHIMTRGKNGWICKKELAMRGLKLCQNKEDAIDFSLPYILQGYDIIIHNKNGTVESWLKSDLLS